MLATGSLSLRHSDNCFAGGYSCRTVNAYYLRTVQCSGSGGCIGDIVGEVGSGSGRVRPYYYRGSVSTRNDKDSRTHFPCSGQHLRCAVCHMTFGIVLSCCARRRECVVCVHGYPKVQYVGRSATEGKVGAIDALGNQELHFTCVCEGANMKDMAKIATIVVIPRNLVLLVQIFIMEMISHGPLCS